MPLFPIKSALAALLLAAPLAQAQQVAAPATSVAAPTKTKIKATRRSASQSAQAMPAAGPMAAPVAGTPPPPPAGGAPRPNGPGGPGMLPPGGPGASPGMPRQRAAQALTDYTGTLTGYAALNDEQVYDAFMLQTSTGTDTVRFPRHLAQRLMAAAKAGSRVTVSGFRDANSPGRPALHLVSLTAGGQTLLDTPPTPPATPPTEEATTVRGTVQRLAQDPRGRPNAVVLSDGTLVRLSPDAAAQLSEKLRAGAALSATGTLRAARPGEVAARPVRVVHAQTITLDGVQFLIH